MENDSERLRRIEEKLDALLARESPSEPTLEAPTEPENKHRSKPRLRPLATRKLEDGSKAYRTEVYNYGKGVAHNIRWWLESRQGDVLTTVAGGEEVSLAHRERIELEVTVLPGVEDRTWQVALTRLTWRDVAGEHEYRPSVWK